jgi:hypothetical protein
LARSGPATNRGRSTRTATIAKAGSLESSVITDAFGSVAKDEWALWKPTIKKLQENDEGAYAEFERMAEEAD